MADWYGLPKHWTGVEVARVPEGRVHVKNNRYLYVSGWAVSTSDRAVSTAHYCPGTDVFKQMIQRRAA